MKKMKKINKFKYKLFMRGGRFKRIRKLSSPFSLAIKHT